MKVIEKIKRKIISFMHNYRIKCKRSSVVGGQELIQKIQEIDDNNPLGTSSWEKYRGNIREAILNGCLSDFINWRVVQQTMFFEAPKVEYSKVKNNHELFSAISESKIGCPKPYYLNRKTSGNLIHHAYSLSFFLDSIGGLNLDSVIEFGGGYGSMCRLIRNLGFDKSYIIYDLPEFLSLQEFYLRNVNPKYLDNTLMTDKMNDLKGGEECLFIATWSISEAPIKLRDELFSSIKFGYCLIAFQSSFDNIDNYKYFKSLEINYPEVDFKIFPIEHLKNQFYLIGKKK